jgi:hypothetical protein
VCFSVCLLMIIYIKIIIIVATQATLSNAAIQD